MYQNPARQISLKPAIVETSTITVDEDETLSLYTSQFSPKTTQPQTHTVFDDKDNIFSSTNAKATHWSIAWSDLMMTMFILFLSLFVYQSTHKDFLISDELNIVAGQTTQTLDIEKDSKASFPFIPIKPGLPLMTAGTVKKVEPIRIIDVDADRIFSEGDITGSKNRLAKELASAKQDSIVLNNAVPLEPSLDSLKNIKKNIPLPSIPINRTISKQEPVINKLKDVPDNSKINQLYSSTKENLIINDLEKFAAIDLVPDKTMRITLTSDLLFKTGSATLSDKALESLDKTAKFLKETPYEINVSGHTDNVPISSSGFASNWELSLARATQVAKFLMEKMDMNPGQFVVSGYSSYRPVASNETPNDRAANRRVEITITQKTPAPLLVAGASSF